MVNFRRCITYPGDLSLRFLVWRDKSRTSIYIFTLPLALAAVGLLLLTAYIDDLFKTPEV